MLNFIALIFEHYLLTSLRTQQNPLSHQRLREELQSLEYSKMTVQQKQLILYAKISPDQHTILCACSIPIPQNHFLN
jgi:hypothetical protein